MDFFGTYLRHAQSCDNVRVHSATQWTALAHTLRMPKAVITFMFKVLQDCFGAYFTHAQSCANVRVHSATEWTASVHTLGMPKAVITFVCIVLRNGLLSVHTLHMPKAVITFMFKVLQDWTASVHTLHMPKAVIKFVFEVYGMDCWRTYLHMPKSVITFVFKVLRNGLCFRRFRVFAVFAFSFFPVSVLGVFAFSRFRVPPAAPPRPGHRFRVHSSAVSWQPFYSETLRLPRTGR